MRNSSLGGGAEAGGVKEQGHFLSFLEARPLERGKNRRFGSRGIIPFSQLNRGNGFDFG